MLKHMEDAGKCNMLIDNAGELLVICSECKMTWTGKIASADSSASKKRIAGMINAARRANPSVLKNLDIDYLKTPT